MRARGETLEVKLHVLVQILVAGQQVGKRLQLRPRRQVAVDDQIGRLDEIGFLGHLLDGDAAIAQDALVAVNEGDVADARAGVAVAVVNGDVAGVRRAGADTSTAFSFSLPVNVGSVKTFPSSSSFA